MTTPSYSVHSVHKTLLDTLHQYLSAQYHIWDEWLISERDRIFEQPGNTFQEPRLEATPQYSQGSRYPDLKIPEAAKSILVRASSEGSTGIPKIAYTHQCKALEHFLAGKNLIVATGTGSGKTESFLMPILSSLAIEAESRPQSWRKTGVRAILLYPMNALVNDQLGRLRRLFGNPTVSEKLQGANSRRATFGMYTSRSPYPGIRSNRKDKERIEDEIRKLYLEGMTADYRSQLKVEGKWPAKDLASFLGSRLETSPTDSELLTRHEMQCVAPDILVTNYSMLEYMMLRPLEAPIFQQTAEWLQEDSQNELIIVLDEAHMYRGSGGAEVAYLLRRLRSRLNVAAHRIRFILTSASLGSSEAAETEITNFAEKLTGGPSSSFNLVVGDLEKRSGGEPADALTQKTLSEFDFSAILSASMDVSRAQADIVALSKSLSILVADPSPSQEGLQQYAFRFLEKLPVALLVAERLSRSPLTLTECAELAFPYSEGRLAATEALLALMSFAKDYDKSRSFCPIRSHMFFRGLPGLFACTNIECGSRASSGSHVLGRLHANARLRCECGSRVYELLTHRSCGASFLRGYLSGADGDFLWHQPSNGTWTETQLVESQFYVVSEQEAATLSGGTMTWLHTLTGQLLPTAPSGKRSGEYLPLLRPSAETREQGRRVLSLKGDCPACGQRSSAEAPLAMDLATKGEAPFAHLIRAQVAAQPLTRPQTPQTPNGGRKTIVFSDGRQKAARLARDIPREIELDVFRQTIFVAAKLLLERKREPRLHKDLYVAFLKCLLVHDLRFFDGDDRAHIENDLRSFNRFYDGDLEAQLQDDSLSPPPSYWAILLKQLGTPFYSVSALTLGYVAPVARPIGLKIASEIDGVTPVDLEAISVVWIQRLLARFAFGRDIPDGVRNQASRYPIKRSFAADGFSRSQKALLESKGLNVDHIANCLASNLCDAKPDGSIYLRPAHISLRPALDDHWAQCARCKSVSPRLLFGRCPNCTDSAATLVDPNSTSYLRARKGFWRDPVARAVALGSPLMNIDVQEHSAQLSHKDASSPSPTTEVFERQFRDILRPGERAIDVLSCTTTMEVGIDIGSLISVSMRNVPPMRQNYQQRAGRAGRRGSSVSTVVTYAQSSAHDAHYFQNPNKILAGDPPKPVLDTSNPRITDRHLLAQLLQDFFRPLATASATGDIYTALGDTWTFYNSDKSTGLEEFKSWVRTKPEGIDSLRRAEEWLPEGQVAASVADAMIQEIEARRPSSEEGLETSLIEFLFSKGLLPSYAFPTDLCALQIQEPTSKGGFRTVEKAQQGLSIALSEYAPGRLVVVNKKTYRIGTVASSGPDTEVDRAKVLFDQSKVHRSCTQCSYTAGFIASDDGEKQCPQCGSGTLRTMTVIRPEMVFPDGRKGIDEFEDQVFSRVTQAQLPLPEEDRRIETKPFGVRGGLAHLRKQRLVVVNEGDPESDEVGFRVCCKCGKVLSEGDHEGTHARDYYIRSAGQQLPPRCDGEFKSVFLGYAFTSDVLLLRVNLDSPLRFGILERRDRKPLEDALQTLCEALTLSMGRILDIDTKEVSAGYRLGNDGSTSFADIFIYDTLSGGAGYALQAGESFASIFAEARTLLYNCDCTTSCEKCLRHYSNRFFHADLDRSLGIDLANYVELGLAPEELSEDSQLAALHPLLEMVRLAGWKITNGPRGTSVAHNGRALRLAACPSLRACDPKVRLDGETLLTFTPYELARDLPSAFAELV
ncbi:DEAD/DEAH box helicase [Pseudoxanthomonas sp. LH2527]|uniref:DEAD/DEAH box helicase n=1 Tax=Pseudoxanthomonas sp. LH2527 TaxID=2923249 RepID=UPI001F12AA3B|nr:DEAD/DEAH box helicase [Pseudoxanthomonas sp. LH2527]MCH6483650.1 DEAD/DEAH box helicase [Pseudoxanthomonas sp. LH2527]